MKKHLAASELLCQEDNVAWICFKKRN